MLDIIMSWPLLDRVIAALVIGALTLGAWFSAIELGRIRAQNERIIGLLVDIKIGRRDLP